MTLEEQIRGLLPDDSEYITGFANLTGMLEDTYEAHHFAISIGKKLSDGIIDSIITGPTLEYYNLYKKTNKLLSNMIQRVSAFLESCHISNIPIEPTIDEEDLEDEYYKTLRTDFSHKMAATRAGIGWIGKTDLLVTEKFGPRLRLATILIDRPVGLTATPINESRCGNCALCVEKCPAGAASGRAWSIDVDRDVFYNPFKCREKCLELSWNNFQKRVSICGICISVCPIGKRIFKETNRENISS